MAHHPIVETRNLGRFDTVEIRAHQQGVLYKKGIYQNTLQPHQTIGRMDMSTAGCTLYILDCRPHKISWRVNLPAKNRRDQFPLAIEFTYEIKQGHKFIDSGERDTEKLIEEKLKPELRRVTKNRELGEYRTVESEIEETLEETRFFDDYGLSLDSSSIDVLACFSDEELAIISGQNLPQQIRRTAELPSFEALYPFEAEIVIKYEVIKEGLYAKAISDAVEWIWQSILNRLRAVSAQFKVNQLQEAQASLRTVLEQDLFGSDGVRVQTSFIELSLGEMARAHAIKLDEIDRAAQIDELADKRRIAHLERMIKFFEMYLPPEMKITALGMSDEQISIREAVERMDKRRQEQLAMQMNLLEALVKADALPETIQAKAAEALLGTLAGHAMSGLGLPQGVEKPALTDNGPLEGETGEPKGTEDTPKKNDGIQEEAVTGIFTTEEEDKEDHDEESETKPA